MSLYEVQRLMHEIHRDHSYRERYLADRESTLTEYSLSEAERAALLNDDIVGLWEMGCHPLLLLMYARATGVRPDRYYELVRSSPTRWERRSS